MRLKKLIIFTGFLFLGILFLGVVSADCDIRLRADCQLDPWDNVLMGLSSETNAHGRLWNSFEKDTDCQVFPCQVPPCPTSCDNLYNYVLCCDFAQKHTCNLDVSNKILGISADTNAHAEIPSLDNYEFDVCYGDLECRNVGTGNCDASEFGMISLSDSSNAHIGSFGSYSNNICCGRGGQEVYWADINREAIFEVHVDVGTTKILMVLADTFLLEGTEVVFEIYEDDLLFDDEIRIGDEAIVGIVGSDGTAVAEWIVTETDLDNARGIGDDDLSGFYFIVNGELSSNVLNVILIDCLSGLINDCGDYNQDQCGTDSCGVSGNTMPDNIDCGSDEINCGCWWNENESICGSIWGVIDSFGSCGNDIVNTGETCDGTEWGGITGCSDFDSFIGGILSCNSECNFDTSLCAEGSSGSCGDGTINTGETCDGTEWSGITGCSDFGGFTEGTLSCNSNCVFNTTLCTVEGEDFYSILVGECKYTEDTNDNCEDNFLTYSLDAIWIWDANNPSQDDPDSMEGQCVDIDNTIPCPAQIQLPFFSWGTFIITMIILILIYALIGFKKTSN